MTAATIPTKAKNYVEARTDLAPNQNSSAAIPNVYRINGVAITTTIAVTVLTKSTAATLNARFVSYRSCNFCWIIIIVQRLIY